MPPERRVKIPATLQPLLNTTQRPIPSLLKQLEVGQTLQAKVLAEVNPGLLKLQIATTELLARSRTTIPPGTRLTLEVTKGFPLPELRILRQPTVRDQQEQTVRSAMARQLRPAEVREAIGELRSRELTPKQSEAIRQLTGIVRQAGVRPEQLAPAQLQRAMAHSGLFHEARLATQQPAQGADTKTQLLRLLSQLQNDFKMAGKQPRPAPQPGEAQQPTQATGGDSLLNRLIRLIEGSVARIQLQQGAALPVEEGQRQAWQIDLPIQLPDTTHETLLRIERDEADGEDGSDASWAVNLAFEFDTIGAVQCRIALAGDRVSTTFWSERQHTHERVEQRLPCLQDALEAQGLEVLKLAGVLGEPNEPLIRVPMPESLLDVHA